MLVNYSPNICLMIGNIGVLAGVCVLEVKRPKILCSI